MFFEFINSSEDETGIGLNVLRLEYEECKKNCLYNLYLFFEVVLFSDFLTFASLDTLQTTPDKK